MKNRFDVPKEEFSVGTIEIKHKGFIADFVAIEHPHLAVY
jgi:hypothetical protein